MEKAVNILFISCLTTMIISVLLATLSLIVESGNLLGTAVQVLMGLSTILALSFLLLVGIAMAKDSQ